LLKLRDATKAQGSAGKGFEACLSQIGISKTQAYRFMHAAETGQPVDYDNAPTSSRNGTKLPLADAEPWQIEAAVFFRHLEALGVQVGHIDSTDGERKPCYVLPHGVVLTSVGAIFPDGLTYEQYLETMAILRVIAPLPADDRSEHQRKLDARRTRRMENQAENHGQ
jgi:hypothetical protein